MDPWVTPTVSAATAVIKNREHVAKAWDRILAKTIGRGFNIAIVGEAGVGKTVLVDHLVGDAFSADYRPPGRSARVEKDSRKLNKHRYKFSVVPGQPIHRDRIRDLEDVLTGKPHLDGIIYMVANGYHELRTTFAEDIAASIQLTDIAQLRERRLQAELADFRSTLALLRRSIGEHRQPSWMILAVNKADLFCSPDALAVAREQYVGESSEFRQAVDEFLSQVGSDNFKWTAIPTCAWLEAFSVGDERIPSSLSIDQRNAMLHSLFDVMERTCQGKT
jgi:GTPase SAR1 family protein